MDDVASVVSMLEMILKSRVSTVVEDEREVVNEGPAIVEGMRLLSSYADVKDSIWYELLEWAFNGALAASDGDPSVHQGWVDLATGLANLAPKHIRDKPLG